jgi:hypothetical protein
MKTRTALGCCLDLIIPLQRCFHVIFSDAHLHGVSPSKYKENTGHAVSFNMLQTNIQMDKYGDS